LIAAPWSVELVPVIKFLLEQNNINLNIQDIDGQTALHHLCGRGIGETIEGHEIFQLIFQKPVDLHLKVKV